MYFPPTQQKTWKKFYLEKIIKVMKAIRILKPYIFIDS
jgi:hypothetical protein